MKLDSRITRLIVATASLGAIIALGIPWVDEYFELRREVAEFDELHGELKQIRDRSERLIQIEENLNEKLNSLNTRSINPETKDLVREQLVEIVRRHGGRLRSLEVHTGIVRPWATSGDNPLADAMPEFGEESEYVLHSHDVELRADGTLGSIEDIIASIAQEGWFASTRSMNVLPTGKPEAPAAIELRLTVFGLTVAPEEPEEEFAAAGQRSRRPAPTFR